MWKKTNVTTDAYAKQRIRKSYTIFRDLFNILNKFYDDNKKEMISNSCVVNNGLGLQKDIEKINNLDNINTTDTECNRSIMLLFTNNL